MPCPTCDHTLSNLGLPAPVNCDAVFWCARCGTIVSRAAGQEAFVNISVPLWMQRKPFVILASADGRVVELGHDQHRLFKTELDRFVDAEIRRRLTENK